MLASEAATIVHAAVVRSEVALGQAIGVLSEIRPYLDLLEPSVQHRINALADIVDTAREVAGTLAKDQSRWGNYSN